MKIDNKYINVILSKELKRVDKALKEAEKQLNKNMELLETCKEDLRLAQNAKKILESYIGAKIEIPPGSLMPKEYLDFDDVMESL